jgi:hypothetical protein
LITKFLVSKSNTDIAILIEHNQWISNKLTANVLQIGAGRDFNH